MKKLTAVQFEDYIQKGGSTKPWIVLAVEEGNKLPIAEAYVVKLFKKDHALNDCALASEFIVAELARELDLVVPDSAIMTFSNDFVETLTDEQIKFLEGKQYAPTFSSRLLNSSTLVMAEVGNLSSPAAELAKLFAFDCMVINTDRGGFRDKPNLLVDDDGFTLIDHELCLFFLASSSSTGINKLMKSIKAGNIDMIQYGRHIFYQKLKSYKGKKVHLFNEFEENLSKLNVAGIVKYAQNLEQENIPAGSIDSLNEYLSLLKQNASQYCNILLGLIR
ncbi:HipA family kinase [Hufsiella ginkgonis]|uniref:HipA-like kinase domain-containing protein n=1 Tax=Hufsiella ginkgonis TaxID=2695274 RepID=A0A7K1XU57_9SPHI|nr:HipA family kinase [Hufsiella ginkgonis]MXV14338.1 hypothetical protein [Hufsiella ginkgonis]